MALYDFKDTIDHAPQSRDIPVEALKINGKFIEDLIPGYRTLGTSGRQLINRVSAGETIGTNDGSFFDYSRIPERTITVWYRLEADTPKDFRNKFNKLNSILHNEQSELIFNDESDKYFMGTLSDIDDVEMGVMTTTGSFSFLCNDPYKYDVNETVVNFASGADSAVLTNDGAGSALVNIEATMSGDNGYIGAVLGRKVYQQGLVEQPDAVPMQRSETLLNGRTFVVGSNVISGVTPTKLTDALTPGTNQFSTKTSIIPFTSDGTNSLRSTEPFVADSAATYAGGGLVWKIPTDSQGNASFANWRLNADFWYELGRANQQSLVMAYVLATDNTIVARIILDKYSANSPNGLLRFRLNEEIVKDIPFSVHAGNDITRKEAGMISIQKSGEVFTFKYANQAITTRSTAMASKKVNRVVFYGGVWQIAYPVQMTRRDLTSLVFIADNVDYMEDIPNFFSDGDVWRLDSENNQSYVNNTPTGVMRDIASEPLVLPSGDHELFIGRSSWATMPNVKVTYRKRYL